MNRTDGALMQLLSTLVCPLCQHSTTETMATDACQFFYDCKGCGQRLKPKPGDCCVLCSYVGAVPAGPAEREVLLRPASVALLLA